MRVLFGYFTSSFICSAVPFFDCLLNSIHLHLFTEILEGIVIDGVAESNTSNAADPRTGNKVLLAT
jgi:uncharacterized membrane protein YfhO